MFRVRTRRRAGNSGRAGIRSTRARIRGTRARRTAFGSAVVTAAVAAAVLGFASPAAAHVTVDPSEAVQGEFTRVAFRVPTESDTASTTRLEVVLPEDAPIASVSTMPLPGWTVTVQRRKLEPPIEVHGSPVSEVVSSLTWTADASAGIKPGQFQEFPVSLGPLPEVDQIVFKALQTYSDGTVVRWIEEPPADGSEPANPAPVLKLAPPASHGASASASPDAGSSASAGGDEASGSDGTARALGIAGLVAGAGGLALGALAFARTRRRGGESTGG